jgi:hypothetical protein
MIEISSGRLQKGYLPNTALHLVNTWRLLHLEELQKNWDRARQQLPLLPIPPLE